MCVGEWRYSSTVVVSRHQIDVSDQLDAPAVLHQKKWPGVGPSAGLEAVEQKNLLLLLGIEPWRRTSNLPLCQLNYIGSFNQEGRGDKRWENDLILQPNRSLEGEVETIVKCQSGWMASGMNVRYWDEPSMKQSLTTALLFFVV